MPDWNHNGRRDLFDSFIDYEIINGDDDAAPYVKRTRTPSPSENERLNGTIRYIIQNQAKSDCLTALKAIDVYLASERSKNPRNIWRFGLEFETAEMLNDLRKACVEELQSRGADFAKEAEELHRQVLKYEGEKLMRSRRLEEQKREKAEKKARKAARRKERFDYVFKFGWLRKWLKDIEH